jgi:hypothetical protein
MHLDSSRTHLRSVPFFTGPEKARVVETVLHNRGNDALIHDADPQFCIYEPDAPHEQFLADVGVAVTLGTIMQKTEVLKQKKGVSLNAKQSEAEPA